MIQPGWLIRTSLCSMPLLNHLSRCLKANVQLRNPNGRFLPRCTCIYHGTPSPPGMLFCLFLPHPQQRATLPTEHRAMDPQELHSISTLVRDCIDFFDECNQTALRIPRQQRLDLAAQQRYLRLWAKTFQVFDQGDICLDRQLDTSCNLWRNLIVAHFEHILKNLLTSEFSSVSKLETEKWLI